MILNYRVEYCRTCYWKQTTQCSRQDTYITNTNPAQMVNQAGECLRRMQVPWLVD